MRKILLLISIFLHVFILGQAQVPVKISEEIINLSGKKFYLHKVEAGQTLYSISKAYKTTQEIIKAQNKLLSDNLKSGQLLKIPFTERQETNTSPDFFYHKVKQGETLFSLSQKYYISLEEIIEANPIVKYGLKTDQILKIPNSFKKDREEYFLYTVEKGNTLFSISQKFNVSQEELIKLNKGIENGIQAGESIKIPRLEEKMPENDTIPHLIPDSTHQDSSIQKGLNDPLYFTDETITPCHQFQYNENMTFNIALLLPLFIEENLKFVNKYQNEKDPLFYKNTKQFTDFYEGVLLAMQQAKSQGISINLKVYDTENDSLKVENIMSSLDYPNIDLIIGPVYTDNVKIAAKYANRHRVNLVSPLSGKLSQLENNPFVFQAVPSTQSQIDKLSKILKANTDSTNIILVYNGSENEKQLIERFEKAYRDSYYSSYHGTDTSFYKIIRYDADIKKMDEEQQKINKALKPGFQNIVYIPSNNEVFVTQVIDKLYAADKSTDIKIVGSEMWFRFQNFNISTFQRLSFNFTSSVYTDYKAPKVKDFVNLFRLSYKTEPSKYALEGYDIARYFTNTLQQYGRIFQFCLTNQEDAPAYKGLIYNFNFERLNATGGFENKESFLLKLNNTFQTEQTNFKE